jgi:spore coat polysaccharide biosynthesis predicted glycosyltransferase SpsG
MKKLPKILFRTSGGMAFGKELGMGHIYRSMNLATHLKNSKLFFLIEDYGFSKEVVSQRNFKQIFTLKKNISLHDDLNQTIQFIKKYDIDILIIDKYNLKLAFVKELSKIVTTIVISDLKRIDFPATLVFNGFIGFKNKSILNKYGTKCFLGPNYQILDSRFSKKLKLKKKYDLLTTFGGFDEKDLSNIILKKLSSSDYNFKVKLILGPAYDSTKLKKIKKTKHLSLDVIKQTNNLQKEIAQSKFVICSGGITTYELCNTGIPFAIISQVKHQTLTAKEWEKKCMAINLGMPNTRLEKKLNHCINLFIKKQIRLKSNTRIVDGFGGQRVSKEILKFYNLSKL